MNIETVKEVTNHLVHIVETAPMWLSELVLFFAASIEYVFPPFPGDTVLVAGGFFAARGALFLPLTFIVLVCGSTTGCILGWWIGRASLRYSWSRRCLFWFVKPENLERLNHLYQRYGIAILIVNRFLPGVRGAFMIASGLASIPLRLVLIWGTVSALLWNSVLIAAGYFLSDKLESLLQLVDQYTKLMFILLGFFVLIWIFYYLTSVRRK